MRSDYQLAICPHCEEESVLIPVTNWDTSYEAKTGLQGFFPNPRPDEAECKNGCFLTRNEKKNLEVVDHIWDDHE